MKANFKNVILIPTDFSEACDNAISHGVDLAKSLNHSVTILHVINKETKTYLSEKKLGKLDIEEKLKKLADKYTKESGVEVSSVVKSGNIFKKIPKVAADIGAMLIILGTHGKVGFQRLTGSYALKVVTAANVPTIVVQKRTITRGYKNIVFPVTAQTEDRQKIKWAVYIAQIFNSTIHIYPRFETEKYFKTKIMTITKQIKIIFDKHKVKYIDKVSEDGGGNFAKQVIDYAVVNDSDLIMIMTTKGGLPMLDSQDEQLMFNSSQIPVICINPVKIKRASWH